MAGKSVTLIKARAAIRLMNLRITFPSLLNIKCLDVLDASPNYFLAPSLSSLYRGSQKLLVPFAHILDVRTGEKDAREDGEKFSTTGSVGKTRSGLRNHRLEVGEYEWKWNGG